MTKVVGKAITSQAKIIVTRVFPSFYDKSFGLSHTSKWEGDHITSQNHSAQSVSFLLECFVSSRQCEKRTLFCACGPLFWTKLGMEFRRMTLECPPGFIFIKKVHYLCLSFLEDNSFVDWLVKERLVANKLKEKRIKKNLV